MLRNRVFFPVPADSSTSQWVSPWPSPFAPALAVEMAHPENWQAERTPPLKCPISRLSPQLDVYDSLRVSRAQTGSLAPCGTSHGTQDLLDETGKVASYFFL
jgi:hypothetical protein